MDNGSVGPAAPRPWRRTALGIAAFAVFLAYAFGHGEAVALVWSQVRAPYLALLSLPAFAVIWAQGKVFQRSCRAFGVHIPERESLALAVLTTAGNYAGALRLGAVAKAMYVKRARNLSLTDSLAIVMGGSAVALLAALVGGVALLLHLPAGSTRMGDLTVTLLLGACGLLLAILFAPAGPVTAAVHRVAPAFARERLAHLVSAWAIVRGRRSMPALFAWTVAIYFFAAVGFYIGFTLVLEREIGFTAALAFTILTSLASMAALTPGNLGLQEFVIVALAQSFDLGEGAGVVVAAALRIVQVVVIVALTPFAWRTLRADRPRASMAPTQPASTHR